MAANADSTSGADAGVHPSKAVIVTAATIMNVTSRTNPTVQKKFTAATATIHVSLGMYVTAGGWYPCQQYEECTSCDQQDDLWL